MRKLTNMGGKTLFVMVLSSALLAAGCMEEGGAFGGAGSRERTLALRMEAATKVSVDDASGVCSWTAGDAVAVRISGTAPEENKYETPAVDASSGTVNVNLEGDQDIAYYSVFPASARVDDHYGGNGTDLRVKYAPSYALPSGLTGDALNKWSPLPMVAKNTAGSTSLDFYHAGGVLRIKMLNFPSATSCTVTLQGMEHVTGTYKVSTPGTATATTSLVAGTGDGNTVEFTGIPSIPAGQPLWINLPLPTGDYASLTSVKVEAGGKAVIKAVKWNGGISHAQGRRLSYDFDARPGELASVNIGSEDPVTLWVGEPHQRTAMACDANGTFISGATISWESSDPSVATVDNGGNVTTKAAGSAVLTATATLDGVSKTAEYTVYVNEITGLSLSCGSTMTLRTGTASSVTATAVYTTNGTPEVPEVNWVVAPSTLATLANTTTASGAANTLTGGATGSGTLTVSIPANKYGTNAALAAMCNLNVKSHDNTLPGKFSISPTEQVQFSRGNLQVNYTGTSSTSTGYTREWLFSENQWDLFTPTAEELNSMPTPAEGTTVKLSYFGWATAGHKNPSSPDDGPYGYNTEQHFFEPHHNRSQISDKQTYGAVTIWYDNESGLSMGYTAGNDWKCNDDLRLYCDWGIHFDDNGVGHDDKVYRTTWFTLSYAQWKYLFIERAEALQRVSLGRIVFDPNDVADLKGCVNGMIIVPDDWVCPAGCTFITGSTYVTDNGRQEINVKHGYMLNSYSVENWSLMEASGAVFLPAGGARYAYPAGTYDNANRQPYSPVFNYDYTRPCFGSGAYHASSCISSASLGILFDGVNNSGTISIKQSIQKPTGANVRLVRYAN